MYNLFERESEKTDMKILEFNFNLFHDGWNPRYNDHVMESW